jgi:curved DNA-binding protein CbpA
MAPGTQVTHASNANADVASNNSLGCVKCGRDVIETDAFCIYCGTKVSLSIAARTNAKAETKVETKAENDENKAIMANKTEPKKKSNKVVFATDLNNENRYSSSRAPENSHILRVQSDTRLNTSSRESTHPAPRSSHNMYRGSLPNYPSEGRFSLEQMPQIAGLDQLWVPDDFSTECMDCKAIFGWPKPRRHHCRVCGLLFCRPCVQSKMQIPSSFGYGSSLQRCCRNCVTALEMNAITSPADVFAQRKGNRKSCTPVKLSPYEVLGLTKGATSEEITRQYKTLTRSCDTSKEDGKEKLLKLKEAYRLLQDPVSRLRHDSNTSLDSNEQQNPTEQARSDQQECQVCFRPFKLGRRQHHCRRCTRSVCNTCSEGSKPIPELGLPMAVRHCSTCMNNPLPFVAPVIEPVSKPPAGFEYLSKLDIHLGVRYLSSPNADDEIYEIKTFCAPNEESVKNARYVLTDNDREIAMKYNILHKRSYADFEWLLNALGECSNSKALPFFPDRRQIKTEKERGASALQTFLFGCMIHPLLRDTDCLKAFLVLPGDEFIQHQLKGAKARLYGSEKYSPLMMSLRLEFEKAQMRLKLEVLRAHEKDHNERVNQQKARLALQKKRETLQNVRREQAAARFKALEARKISQTKRMAREKERFDRQANNSHILFFDVAQDKSARQSEEEVRQQEKVEFTKSKDSFQTDTTQWNNDMALWSKHRAAWSEHQNPESSKGIANNWIIKSYGIYHSHSSSSSNMQEVPKELIEMHQQIAKLQEKEVISLEKEGNALDDEWAKLDRERQHWTTDRVNMKREDEMCDDEDKRYAQEHDFVKLEAEARRKKVQTIELDLDALQVEIASRKRSIAQRKARHESLNEELEKDWKPIQQERHSASVRRLDEHLARLQRGSKRVEIFNDQLKRQTQSSRMLLFKRARFNEERKADCTLFEEHICDCKIALEEIHASRGLTPKYVSRLESDLKLRNEEMKNVVDSNKRTPLEGEDAEVDERDEFMNGVRRRRAQYQQELNEQKASLDAEEKLCTSMLTRMREHVQKLEEEVANAAKEDQHIKEFRSLLETESKLLADEEAKRDQKKKHITSIMNEAGNWVLDALHRHSKRKKKEADRLVKQALRAAELQKLVQHFTHRVIEQEERILRQKQRILNGEHKVEMLKSSESWYQYVRCFSPDLSRKDYNKLEEAQRQRGEDLKVAAKLQKEDESDMQHTMKLLDTSKNVAKEQEFKRELWREIEKVYSTTKAQEKDEDMMLTSQIRSLLMQLSESFELLTNRLTEEEESLQHASAQLEGEVESIYAFMDRMESEENALCNTEKTSLQQEASVRKNEEDLIEQRSRALVESYKKLASEHAKYPMELEKIKAERRSRECPVMSKEMELDAAKKLLKARNYYDKAACASFAKKFKVVTELKEVRDVFDWLKSSIDKDIKRMEKWMEASRKERKRIESLKVKGREIDWVKDTLSKIPAFKEVLSKLEQKSIVQAQERSISTTNLKEPKEKKESKDDNKNLSPSVKEQPSAAEGIHKKDQWLVELIGLKKTISEVDIQLLREIESILEAANTEEEKVAIHLHKMKQNKEYVLNSLRFIDQEEAKAIRNYDPKSSSSVRGSSMTDFPVSPNRLKGILKNASPPASTTSRNGNVSFSSTSGPASAPPTLRSNSRRRAEPRSEEV